jgi:hypothetical protein
MSQQLGRMIGSALLVLCVLAFSIGAGLLGKAYTMQAHVDERKAQELTAKHETEYHHMPAEQRERDANEIVGMRTAKWLFYNIGVRICLIASTLTVLILRFRLWNIRNLKMVTTPRTRWRLIALAGVTWLGLIPAFSLDLEDAYAQDDLLPSDDAGHGIFLGIVAPYMIVIWIVSALICRFVVLRKINLPVSLWRTADERTLRSVGLTIFYGVAVGLLAVFSALSVAYFKWGIPSGLVGIYVMLSSRAGLIGPAQRKT